MKLVRSRSKVNYESRASDDVLRGVGQGHAGTSCAECALSATDQSETRLRLSGDPLCGAAILE